MPAFSVKTNTLATSALLTLNGTNAELRGVHRRVTTGLAVESAKDDGSTFALSMGMRAQIGEFSAVRRNIAGARSLVSAAYAGAEQVEAVLSTAIAKRIRAEGEEGPTNADRYANDVAALMDQAELAIEAANLNGVNLLKGDTPDLFVGRSAEPISLGGTTLSLQTMGLAAASDTAVCYCACCRGQHSHGAHSSAPRADAPIAGAGTTVTSVAVGGGDPDDVQMLVYGTKWGGAVGTGVNLTYSFYRPGVSQYSYSGEIDNNPYQLSAGLETAVRESLQKWADVSGLSFTEVTDDAVSAGELRFGGSSEPPTAWAYYPWANSAQAGDTWFGDYFRTGSTGEGTYTYLTAIHEIGHALGLKHPHPGPFAGTEHDQLQWSVMSYKDHAGDSNDGYWHNPYPDTPMVADIAAIQHLYGANMAHEAGNTVYQWGVGEAILETIWDGGGTDTIDWSNQSSDALIDLRDGAYSHLGPQIWADGNWLQDTVGIAYGAIIENANGGSGADELIGNDADNVLTGNGGNDIMDGGLGDDTAVFSGNYADYSFSQSGSDIYVTGPDGIDTLRNIENLQFDDQTVLATDLVFGSDPPPPPPPDPPDPPDPPSDPPVPDGDGNVAAYLPTIQQLDEALTVVRDAMAQLGSQYNRLTNQEAVTDTMIALLNSGLGELVDANMAVEAARLEALETRQQLAMQALSLANDRPAIILELFRR